MNIRILTIGFTQKSAEQFFGMLQASGTRKLMDIRENRSGQLSGFAKEKDLRYFLDRLIAVEYEAEPLLAPTPAIRDAYKESKDWQAYERSFLDLMEARRIADVIGHERFAVPTALLCSEPAPDRCHRRLVAEFLAERWRPLGHSVEVLHLVSPPKIIKNPSGAGT